ncbi:UNVERIFIED_CONTAM: hypothetical protein FKN15_034897 [Acipenser sinensis]
MRRKEKRLLQIAGLLIAAILFLPNVGLWSLYRDKVLDNSPEREGGTGSAAAQGLHVRPKKEVRLGLDGDRRRDWHDQEGIRRDAARSGSLAGAFHEEASATQVQGVCRTKLYLEKLPNTSIIIPFHNEGWSSLLRTVHSVLHRSPPQLLAEIILVDDFSDKEHLKAALEDYMVRLPKVRIVRTKKREGLIRTRLLGASVAIGGVITFLDSHCEANVNWLPPLLGTHPSAPLRRLQGNNSRVFICMSFKQK